MIEKDYIFVKKNGKDEGGSTKEEEEIVKRCSERKTKTREREREKETQRFYFFIFDKVRLILLHNFLFDIFIVHQQIRSYNLVLSLICML